MEVQLNNCPFCDIDPIRITAENDLAYVVHDGYPVTELHTLIIPKRHADTYFDLTNQERDVFSKGDTQISLLGFR
jgi:diadenosine tetraphosphate (Ap4A) HIT family hydrolase